MSTTINSIEVNILNSDELITKLKDTPQAHLAEVPFGDFQLELDLVDEVYANSVEAGYIRCYEVIVNGNYAGYMVVVAAEMIHHRGVTQATTDSFYIAEEYRSSSAFKVLVAKVAEDLKANGIRFFTIGLNPNMPNYDGVCKFVQRLGYQNTESSFTKELT